MNDAEKIEQWCRETSYVTENMFVRTLRSGGLSDELIVIVIAAMDDTCKHCRDGGPDCQCWNDD